MEAQEVGSTCAIRIAKGTGRQDKETNNYDRRGPGRSRCKGPQYHSFVFGR